MRTLPDLVVHADWGGSTAKRWIAFARLVREGVYSASAPICICDLVQHVGGLIPWVLKQIGSEQCAVVGFDFPIGVPEAYARAAGIRDFRSFLQQLGAGDWARFYDVAHSRTDIALTRPFYPFRPGGTTHTHLVGALGVDCIDSLRRRCERAYEGRKPACPLFWTLGASQVGKGAITGWRDVLAPALRAHPDRVALWPFDGPLETLLKPGRVVIVETHPAECYRWFFKKPLNGKRKTENRKAVAKDLLRCADTTRVTLDGPLERNIKGGFPEGDDAFDAVVGLFGMLHVFADGRSPGSAPVGGAVEGWIFGQEAH